MNPSTARPCTLGVDMGTTTLKAIAFDDATGEEIVQAKRGVELRHDAAGAAEQEPRAVYDAITDALAEAASAARAHGYAIARVGMSAAMHSLIPVAADGTPLARAMLWMDARAAAEAATLWGSPEGKALYARTGAPIHAMTPLAKLLWMREQRPDLHAAAARFVSLKEWVWRRWMGEEAVDASIASATGLYNLREGTWDRGALALAGITADRLSPLVPTTHTRRGAREPRLLQAGVTAETVFNVGASDGCLANLGAGALGPDQMALTIGTSCAVRVGGPDPFTDPATRPFCYVLDAGRFIVGGPSNSGGILLDWLFRSVLGPARGDGTARAPDADTRTMSALIAAAEYADPGALLCLPYVAGERAPLWDARASGVFLGLRLEHARAHLMRATIEGMLLNASWIAEPLIARFGAPSRLVASGGVLATDWIRQLTADIFGIPVHYLGDVDASALGAAQLARIATGDLSWEAAARHGSAEETIVTRPRATTDYRAKYARFRRLARALTTDLADVYLGG